MMTARIVALAIALGVGGLIGYAESSMWALSPGSIGSIASLQLMVASSVIGRGTGPRGREMTNSSLVRFDASASKSET